MSKAEELQQKLNELQAEIDALKEEAKKEPLKAMLPTMGQWSIYGGAFYADADEYGTLFANGVAQNVFPDQETAEAYADAFRVMLELRRQPGSGQLDEEEDGFIVETDGAVGAYRIYDAAFGLCPPFPSKELAQQAAEAVGIERIKQAYATLSNVKGE